MPIDSETQKQNHLIAVLRSYALEEHPLDATKAIDTINKMIGIATTKDYVLALSDGLKYGNWPWTLYQNLTHGDNK